MFDLGSIEYHNYSSESVITGGFLKPMADVDNIEEIKTNEIIIDQASLEEAQLERLRNDIDNLGETATALRAKAETSSDIPTLEAYSTMAYLTLKRIENEYQGLNKTAFTFESLSVTDPSKQINQAIKLLNGRTNALNKTLALAEEGFIDNIKYKIDRAFSNMEKVKVSFNKALNTFSNRGRKEGVIEHPAYAGYLGLTHNNNSASDAISAVQKHLASFNFTAAKEAFKETSSVLDKFEGFLDIGSMTWKAENIANMKDGLRELDGIFERLNEKITKVSKVEGVTIEPIEESDTDKIKHMFDQALDQRHMSEAMAEYRKVNSRLNALYLAGTRTKLVGVYQSDMRKTFHAIFKGGKIDSAVSKMLTSHQNTLHALTQYVKDSTR